MKLYAGDDKKVRIVMVFWLSLFYLEEVMKRNEICIIFTKIRTEGYLQ